MFSSRAFRTAGLLALCLLVGVVLSGALVGAARSLDDGVYLLGKAPIPKGDYRFWMEEIGRLGVKIPPEMDGIRWYIILTTISPDGKIDIRAFLFYRDEVFRTPEQWLRKIGSIIGLKDKGCDLTVRHLAVAVGAGVESLVAVEPPIPGSLNRARDEEGAGQVVAWGDVLVGGGSGGAGTQAKGSG